MCVLVCFAEPREKTGKEREMGERWERKGRAGMKTGKTKGSRGNKDRKTKDIIIGFKCRGNGNRFLGIYDI